MSEHTYSIVTVTLEDRDDNGLRVYSDDLPGLVLSGADRSKVAESIVPAIKALFEHRGIRNIAIHPARPIDDVLQKVSPRHVDMHVKTAQQRTQFVVELTPS